MPGISPHNYPSEIDKIARRVRVAVSPDGNPSPPVCQEASELLALLLRHELGVAAIAVKGFVHRPWGALQHYWVKIDSLIIDVTIDQLAVKEPDFGWPDIFIDWFENARSVGYLTSDEYFKELHQRGKEYRK